MTSWKPPLRPGLYIGSAAFLILLGIEGYVLFALFGREFDLGSFFLALLALLDLVLLAALGYLLYALTRLDYSIDSDALTIRWGVVRHVLPLSAIADVFTSYRWDRAPGNAGINLPGYYVGRGTDKEAGNLQFFATSRSANHVAYVATSGAVYAVSPRDRDSFINTLNRCRTRPIGQATEPVMLAPRLFLLPFWQDHAVQALTLLALAINAAAFAYVSFRFPHLPPVLPLHYNVLGQIDFLGTRVESFKIPSIGTVVLLGNFVVGLMLHSRERLAAITLVGAAVLVQVVLLVAILKILF